MKIIKYVDSNGIEKKCEILFQTNIEERLYAICKSELNSDYDEFIAFQIVNDLNGNTNYSTVSNELDKEKINNLILALVKEGMNQ